MVAKVVVIAEDVNVFLLMLNAKCNIKCKCKNCTNKGTCESSTASGIGSIPITSLQEEEMDDTDELLATSSESDDSVTEDELDIQL